MVTLPMSLNGMFVLANKNCDVDQLASSSNVFHDGKCSVRQVILAKYDTVCSVTELDVGEIPRWRRPWGRTFVHLVVESRRCIPKNGWNCRGKSRIHPDNEKVKEVAQDCFRFFARNAWFTAPHFLREILVRQFFYCQLN